jgi:hypothetical protein
MLGLNERQRTVLTQAFPAVAHLALGALVFGQFVRDQPFSILLGLAGIVVWIGFVSFALALAGGKQ